MEGGGPPDYLYPGPQVLQRLPHLPLHRLEVAPEGPQLEAGLQVRHGVEEQEQLLGLA